MTFYILNLLLCLSYIVLKKRYFDIFTFITLTSLYYSSPLFMGVLYDPSAHQVVQITPKLYTFYGLYFFFLFIVTWWFDRSCFNYKLVEKRDIEHYRPYLIPVGALSILFFLVILAIDPFFYLPNSVDDAIVSQFGVFYPLFCFSTMLALIFSFAARNKIYTAVFMFLIVLTLVAGSRTYFAYSAAIVIFFLGTSYGKIRLATNLKMVLAGLFGFLFLFFYKIFYPFLLEGNLSGIVESITNPALIGFRLFKGSESILVMLNLHYSIERDWFFDGEYFLIFLIRMVPFVSPYIADAMAIELVRYSDLLKGIHYHFIGFGMASSVWGQLFYLFGNIAYIMPLLFFIIVSFANKCVFSGRREFLFLLPFMIMLAVSLTRVELTDAAYILAINTVIYFLARFLYQVLISINIRPRKYLNYNG